ncbi:molybdopterin-dependent oxidoreductase [Crenobacter sp. SG2303]|uniref:Molybdopterin-dependent oxidoreductase n=1 Tax=Crenobacter oryzisoli TaxID=3056844 RepID=A0ABT7XI27_9NEIS|nr:molybdopterin-dependent oxidoreductase [Crenobacter sp. SG2303]MDN0073427.1 molybdopterin-dependent oxidoreductase [Crenobacter sp. SG2303]
MTPFSFSPLSAPVLLALFSTGCAYAADLNVDLNKPALVISAKATKPMTFSLQQLSTLPIRRITTSTQWHHAPQQWEGVSIKALLGKLGATGTSVYVAALNDYAIDIAVADIIKYDPILAYKVDGHYMPVRDKGPLVVIYPYDEYPALNIQFYYNQAVWQVNHITVR